MVRCEIRVIYGDTDQMGVVYYANYLRWFEAGRTEFLRAKGLSYSDFEASEKLILPVAEAGVNYLQPARYDDLVCDRDQPGDRPAGLGPLRIRRPPRDRTCSPRDSPCTPASTGTDVSGGCPRTSWRG